MAYITKTKQTEIKDTIKKSTLEIILSNVNTKIFLKVNG